MPPLGQLREHAAEAEADGFSSYWLAQLGVPDALTAIATMGDDTSTIEIGTAVIPTWPRHPLMLAAQASTVVEAIGPAGSILGIGLAHKTSVEGTLKIPFATPAKHMEEYLDVLLPVLTDRKVSFTGDIWSAETDGIGGTPVEPPTVMLAAMGPRMLQLAGSRTAGSILWLSGPTAIAEQIKPALDAAAAEAGRPAPRIVASVPVCVTKDADAVKGFVAAALAGYNDLPSYRGVMDTEGAGGPADVSLIGTEAEVLAGHAAVRGRGRHRLRAGGAHPQPGRRRRDPRAAQGRGRRRPRLMGGAAPHPGRRARRRRAVRRHRRARAHRSRDRAAPDARVGAGAAQRHRAAVLETMPSGGRLEMVTDATALELDVQLTLVQLGPRTGPAGGVRPRRRRRADAGESTRTGTLIVIDRYTGAVDFQSGGPTTVRFEGLPAGEKHVEVWLPHAGGRPPHRAARRRGRPAARAERAPAMGALRQLDLALPRGDRPTGVWPVVAARLAGVDLQSFAFAGQCQLDPFAARMIGQQPADLDQPQARHQHRERRLDARAHLRPRRPRLPRPGPRSAPRRPARADHADHLPGRRGPSRADRRRRRRPVLRHRAARGARPRRPHAPPHPRARGRDRGGPPGAGDANLHLLQGPDLFGPDDVGDLPDGLHPNPAGYQRIGERFHALAFQGDGPFAV